MKHLILLLLAATLMTGIAAAQLKYLPDLKAAKELSASSIKLFTEYKYAEAIEILRPYFPLSDDDIINLISTTNEHMPTVKEKLGDIESAEKVSEKMLGTTVLREVYLLNCAKSPLRFVYTYYKSKAGWLIVSFTWDDTYAEELK